ncbi:hypothetical protein PR202_gb00096 [Eleusine coracana subsp. coracana]|uniref:Helicase and polymerase-containing protein TEBICHI n=1 Tax=Eleusine coracana subsp. coracana TaxID=191504 RepID=A0AAV5DSM6_ELECO|nr:hypothetical protein PR202_gb00096 [Eleusine coracana subsp. coracana]
MNGSGDGDQLEKKQKRSASQPVLVPCENASVKKQRIAHCSGLGAQKQGDNKAFKKQCMDSYGGSGAMEESVAMMCGKGFKTLQRCSFTPNTEHKKADFSLAIGETPKSESRNSLTSPGEDFWNAAIEFADGISAQANKARGRPEYDAAEDKLSCAVAACSKTLPRSGKGDIGSPNAVGSNDTHQMEKSSFIESLETNGQPIIGSPLPVKHFDFCHDDENQVSSSKGEENAGSVHMDHSQLKNSGFKGVGNLVLPVDATKKTTLDLHVDFSATTQCQRLLRLNIDGKGHLIQDADKISYLSKRDLNQLSHNDDKSADVYSNSSKPNKDSKSKFSSKEMEASTPTSSLPLKDHSKLSSWLPPELCAVYYKKGISELYPWQVECLRVEGVLEKRNLVYCASTSAGKSFVAEVLMLRRILSSGNMAMLVLPYVSICAEKAEHLEQLLEPLGRHVRSFYGNQGGGSLPKDTAVAVCTIEKANSLVNKMLEDGRLSELGVIVIDELHMAALYQTDFRPVPLEEFIKVGNQILDKELNVVRVLPKASDLGGKDPDHIVELCNEVVLQGHSVLLFCSSRKGCESTARHVAKFLKLVSVGSSHVGSEFSDAASAIEALKRCPAGLDPVLEETLPFGVAYHHAGLTVEEREIVESCYRKGLVRVLTATSTLAAGVNLPARRVIFRQPRIGRDFIDGTRYRQMSGRAGRTGIDTKGESILVCRPEEIKRITSIIRSNCLPLESCLSEDKNGMTHAIMEVVAGGIVQTANDIHRYVRCTLLNSTKPFEDVVKSAQDSLRWLCHKKFVEWNNETKIYTTTPLGRAAFGSSLNPEESLVVLDDLSRAREGFVLASDLHLVYLVTPINVDVEPDWELYYERFMQLSSLEQEIPVADVCEAFKVAREGLVAKFQNRVSFGVRAEIAELTSIPFVKGSRARALYKSGLRTPVAIAEASIPEIAKALFDSSTWCGQDDSALRRMQFGIAKKIKNGARKIVLEEAEAARLAAFSAFKSLGVEVPQFMAPELPTIEDSPTRVAMDTTVPPSGDQANCNKLPLLTHGANDKSNCSNYAAAQRASTDNLAEGTCPGSFIQMNNNLGIPLSDNLGIQEETSPLPTQSTGQLSSRNMTDKGPVNAYNFPGGFDCFLDQWSAVSEFYFDLHFVKKSTKLSSAFFEVFGLAVCWEKSPVYYCNFPKDLVTTGINDSSELVKRRLHSEGTATANRDGRWRNQMHKAAHNGCCRRAALTRALSSVLKKLLVCQNLDSLVETIEGPLVNFFSLPKVNILADMELWGIGADMDACLSARHIIIRKLKELEKEAYRLAGKSFSLNATADIADILYTHLKLPVPKGCEKGKLHPSTDKQSLEHLRARFPLPLSVLPPSQPTAATAALAVAPPNVGATVPPPGALDPATALPDLAVGGPDLAAAGPDPTVSGPDPRARGGGWQPSPPSELSSGGADLVATASAGPAATVGPYTAGTSHHLTATAKGKQVDSGPAFVAAGGMSPVPYTGLGMPPLLLPVGASLPTAGAASIDPGLAAAAVECIRTATLAWEGELAAANALYRWAMEV